MDYHGLPVLKAIIAVTVFLAMAALRVPAVSAQETTGKEDGTVRLEGTVVDAGDGYPLIGVSVMLEGTLHGVATDLDGKFVLEIPDYACNIVFSYVGYETLVRKYDTGNAASFSRIVLEANAMELNDVVVTGVYERKKESFTGASATFKGDQLKKVGSQNIMQSLQTLDPSFRIMESAQFGSNPNTMPDIEIRGKTSVAETEMELPYANLTETSVDITYIDPLSGSSIVVSCTVAPEGTKVYTVSDLR